MVRAVDPRSAIVAFLASLRWLKGARVAWIAAILAACDPMTGETFSLTPDRTGVDRPGGTQDSLVFRCPEDRDRVCDYPSARPLARGAKFLLATYHAPTVARMEFIPEGVVRVDGDRFVAAGRGRVTIVAWDEPAAVIAVDTMEVEDPSGIAIEGPSTLVEGDRSRELYCSVVGLAGGPGCSWTIDDPSVARLEPHISRDWGVVAVPVRAGKTVIRAALEGLEAAHDLTVLPQQGGDP
jgi:hypothetical protein